MLSIAASHRVIPRAFDATITGSVAAPLGAIAITANAGTLERDGAQAQVALYNSVPFAGYTVFGSFVVTPDRWDIAYAYCMGGALKDVYSERVGPGGFVLSAASGSCDVVQGSTPTTFDFPAFTIPTPPAFGQATVHGPAIDLDRGAGYVALEGMMQPAVVFNTVDCATGCGTPGWYELHTLVWNDATHAATFVIIYLRLDDPTHVLLAYAMRLPTLDDPVRTTVLPATWTGTAARWHSARPVHVPPPWQR